MKGVNFMYFILSIFLVFISGCWLSSEYMIRKNYKNNNNAEKYNLNRQLKLISESIDTLDGYQFEEFVAVLFRLKGLKANVTSKTRDGGKDVIVKDKQGIMYIECKHYAEENKITVNLIHKLISACVVDNVRRAIFITTSNFSYEAISLAKRCKQVDIKIWYKSDLLDICKYIDRMQLLEWLGYDKDEVLRYCMI
jgi:restriction system protein